VFEVKHCFFFFSAAMILQG